MPTSRNETNTHVTLRIQPRRSRNNRLDLHKQEVPLHIDSMLSIIVSAPHPMQDCLQKVRMMFLVVFSTRILPLENTVTAISLAKVLFGFMPAVFLSKLSYTMSATVSHTVDLRIYMPPMSTEISLSMLSSERGYTAWVPALKTT